MAKKYYRAMAGEIFRGDDAPAEAARASFSSRAARITAGPMQVKSSRLAPPILP